MVAWKAYHFQRLLDHYLCDEVALYMYILTHPPLDKMATLLDEIFNYIFLNENHCVPIRI